MKKIAALPAEKARAEEANRQHRLCRPPLAGDESPHQQYARRERADDLEAVPAGELPRTSPQTIPKAAALISARPGRSRPVSPPKLSSILARTSGIAATPIGTLSQKIHSQSMPSTIAPPTSGPMATEIPVTALNRPIAALRSGGKAALSSVRPSVSTVPRSPPGPLRRDQPADLRRQRTRGRRRREQPEPSGIEPPPPVAIAERRCRYSAARRSSGCRR